MPRMVARLLGWLLVCDPPQQSSAELARALGVSRASISIATRLLEGPGWIRRTAVPGSRGHSFELVPDAYTNVPAGEIFGRLRRTLEHGFDAVDDPAGPRAARLREAHAFYSYIEQEIPRVVDRYRAERDFDQKGRRPVNAVIRAERLTKRYGNRRGLDGLDLEVRAGEVFGFLGPNGAGKTTTIRLLLDLIRPTSGSARGPWRRPADGRAGTPAPARLSRRRLRRRGRAVGSRAADVPREPPRRRRAGADRAPGRSARSRPRRSDQEPVQGQPPEGRPDPGVHARARAAHPRRAIERARSARPADVPRARR